MDRRRFYFGFSVLLGLILGSVFVNFVYQDSLAYSDQMESLILKKEAMHGGDFRLLLYILLKRGKQYAIIYLVGYLVQPMVFLLVGGFFFSFLMSAVVSLQVLGSGLFGVVQVMLHLFPHYIFYGVGIYLVFRRNLQENDFVYQDRKRTYAVPMEIVCVMVGAVLECFL